MARNVVDIRSLARTHTESGIRQLAGIAAQSESDTARVAAIGMLLDRGWGKAPQTFDGNGEGDIRIVVRHIICGEREPKLIEHGRELVGDRADPVLTGKQRDEG